LFRFKVADPDIAERMEELHVFPLARGSFPESDEVVERLLEQHRKIAVMVQNLHSESGSRLV
jgi:hypothetical protein